MVETVKKGKAVVGMIDIHMYIYREKGDEGDVKIKGM